MQRKVTYEQMQQTLTNALGDLRILAGEVMGPSDSSWQDVAGTAAVNLIELAQQISRARDEGGSFLTFPSPGECLGALEYEGPRGDPDHSNKERSEWADIAIDAFRQATDGSVSDLLADMLHWCDEHKVSFTEILGKARRAYQAETAIQQPTADDPLPTYDERKATVLRTYQYASVGQPPERDVEFAIEAIAGMTSYAAEQAIALSFVKRARGPVLAWAKLKSNASLLRQERTEQNVLRLADTLRANNPQGAL